MKEKFYKNMTISNKVRYIYKQKNKQELKNMFLADILKNFKREYVISEYVYIETTTKNTYKFKDLELVNILKIKPVSNDNILLCLRKNNILIYDYIVKKFQGFHRTKIEEIVKLFLDGGCILKRNREFVYVSNRLSEFVLVFDFHNNSLENILNKNLIEVGDNFLVIENDKIKSIDEEVSIDTNVLKKQFKYLDSYTYDINLYKDDIVNNFIDYKVLDIKKNSILINTKNYKYLVNDYNISSIKDRKNIPLPTNCNRSIDKTNDSIDFDEITFEEMYKTNILVKDFYSDYIKAIEYVNKLGLSIRVITKFILDSNLYELYSFLISDIIYYGNVIYDNYMNGEMIVKTNRFYYLIKENIITNIKNLYKEDIEECSLEFRTFKKYNIEKKDILDLDIKDKIRDYISFKKINSLKVSEHAAERFSERISKKNLIIDREQDIKNDIYKNGEVMLGTYYTDTKLVKGQKNVYVLNDIEIISVWKINYFMENLLDRYFKQVNSF